MAEKFAVDLDCRDCGQLFPSEDLCQRQCCPACCADNCEVGADGQTHNHK